MGDVSNSQIFSPRKWRALSEARYHHKTKRSSSPIARTDPSPEAADRRFRVLQSFWEKVKSRALSAQHLRSSPLYESVRVAPSREETPCKDPLSGSWVSCPHNSSQNA